MGCASPSLSLPLCALRDGIVSRFVATDGGITRVYPRRYLSSYDHRKVATMWRKWKGDGNG